MPDTSSLFSDYVALDAQYGNSSRGLPAQVDPRPIRTVICFKVMDVSVAIPLEEIVELIEVPHCTRLPKVKAWVQGVANVRGKLVPVIDLANFLGGRILTPPSQQRVVLLNINGFCVGLKVDAVVGMRHFTIDTYDVDATSDLESIRPYVVGAFKDGKQAWLVLRPGAVARDEQFMNVAL